MINLTINKADLKRQLAGELAEIRDGNSGVTATALIFTKDDRYSLAVSVTADRIAAYKLNVRTYLGGEAADGNTEIITSTDCYCSSIAEIIDFVVACAACADQDAEKAKKDNATALAHLDAQTAKAAAHVDPVMIEIIHNTARKAAKDLDVYATDLTSKRQVLRSARACVAKVRREIDFHLCSYSVKTGCRLCADILAAVVGIKGATATAYAAAMRSAADHLRSLVPVDPAGRDFYVATISGTEGNQVVVDTVRAESEEAAAMDVVARVYGGALEYIRTQPCDVRPGDAAVFWLWTADGQHMAPVAVHAVDRSLASPMSYVRLVLVNAMGDHSVSIRLKPSELLAIAQARRAAVQPGREFLVATFSGTDADPVVVTPITLTDDMITSDGGNTLNTEYLRGLAARIVARSVYALQGPISGRALWKSRKRSQVVYAVTATGLHGRLIPVLVCEPIPQNLWGTLEDSLNAVSGQCGVNVAGLLSRSRWAADPEKSWGQSVAPADSLTPWTVIAVFPDNGQIYGEHVMARDGTHALALVAAAMCKPDNDEDGVADCDLICAIAGHLAEPNIVYAGADVVSAEKYLETHAI